MPMYTVQGYTLLSRGHYMGLHLVLAACLNFSISSDISLFSMVSTMRSMVLSEKLVRIITRKAFGA